MAGNPITKIIITAKDEASAVFTSLQAKVAGIAAAIGTYFGARMFGDALGSARDFEAAMSRVQAASGASGAELAALKTAAEQAGATTKYTSAEAAGALENLAKAGLDATQAVQALPAVLQLAQAGGVELGAASEYITKAVAGMGLAFTDAGRVADVLAKGANASNTSVEGLAAALSFAAPLANSLGLSLEQTVAIVGKFADAGIDASRAGTALNSILAQFSDPASKFRQELANAGIVTTDFDQALRQLAAAGPAGQKAINAVGQEAGPALRALLNQGIGALDDLKAKLDNAAGSAAETAKTMGQNLDGALKGLGSSWDAARRALVAPLLEPLAKQIDVLAGKFRAAVQDGTVARFGEVIRTAFESGVRAVTDFTTKIDFGAVVARMQALAEQTGQIFSSIADKAAAAGNAVQAAYGVMSAGVNTVLAAIYKAGQGMSWVASAFLADLAKISAGIDRITPDAITEKFKAAAVELRFQAQAAYAVSEEFGKRSTEAFASAAAGAETAAAGWRALTESAQEAAPAAQQTAQALQQTAEQAGLTADQLDALGAGAEVAAGKVVKTGEAAAAVAPQLAEMGSTAQASAEQVAAAFDRLGVTSTEALKNAAANAKRDFEIVRDSGTASVRDIQAAFTAYAQKAIAANGGVADAALKAQAAQHGLKIEADGTGKSIVRSMNEASASTASVGTAASSAATAVGRIGDEAESATGSLRGMRIETERLADAQERIGGGSIGGGGGKPPGAAPKPGTQQQEEQKPREVAGRDPFAEAMRRGLEVDPMVGAEFREAFNAFFNEALAKMRPVSNDDYFRKLALAESGALEAAAEFVKKQKAEESKSGVRTNRYEVRLRLGSLDRTVEVASAQDAQSLTSFLQELERAAGRAA